MQFDRLLVLIICLGITLSSCKVSQKKQNTSNTKITQDVIVNTDLSDTIKGTVSVPLAPIDSVDISAYRLLKDTLAIIGVGDIMMGTNFPSTAHLPPTGQEYLFNQVDSILRDSDVTFGNLEGVMLNKGGKQKYCKNPKICYLFRSPENYVDHLVSAGFDVLSTANNHAGDFGDEGRKNTMRALDSVGIVHAGLLSKPYATFISNGMKYGFAAFSPNTGTMSINDIEKAKSIVRHLDSLVDVVVISFHGGAEGSRYQHVPRKNEYFYGENRGDVYHFSHALIDVGADVVFGHGPHVTRAMEVYKDRFIAYSLGNFCTYSRFNLSGDNGLAPLVKVYTNSGGAFLYGEITPIVQYKPGGPRIDPKKRVIDKLRALIDDDFPASKIRIGDNGHIGYIN